MGKAEEIFFIILRSIPRNRVTILGVIMSSFLFPVLLILLVLDWHGAIENPYFGFLFYLVLGPFFLLGIVLILVGVLFCRGKGGDLSFTYEYLQEQFNLPVRFGRIRKFIYLTTLLTAFFLFLVSVTAFTGFQYTDSTSFCSQFCHSVMQPEFITYQNSPHSRVPCVGCHVGTGAEWKTKAKITGIKQLFAMMTDSHARPLHTPLTGLRPSRETCEECHRPEKFHGYVLDLSNQYAEDEQNTHVQTVMVVKVGSGGHLGQAAHGIHWHTSEQQRVAYTHTDAERKNIVKVQLVDAFGVRATYWKEGSAEAGGVAQGEERIMDCIDCHNRPTHVFLSPEEALDAKLFNKQIPDNLPYIKRQAMAAITREYQSVAAAKIGIARELREWFQANYPEIVQEKLPLLDQGIQGAQDAYAENVFPEMHIVWNTYEDFSGHRNNSGCFRCHDGSLKDASGKAISKECHSCHVILDGKEPIDNVMRIFSY